MAAPSPGGRRPVAGHRCADLSFEGADVAEPEAEATTGLGADTAVAAPAPEQGATVQTASSLVPPQGHSQVKRLKVVDLKSLWTRAEKRPKPSIASNSTPILQTVESNIQSDSPSVQLQTHNEIEVQPEPEVASTDAVPAAVVQEDQPEGNDDEFDDYEINEEAFYDVNWLPHDPGERIPISSYNPNDQADVRKRYIALGACQPRGHDFPRNDIGAIGNSYKRLQLLRAAQAEEVIEALELGEIESGRDLNQEMGLARPADTRWGSHYKTIQHVILMYHSIRQVLQQIADDPEYKESAKAEIALFSFESFEFVFLAHLLDTILGYTDDLNCALQKRYQDILNAVSLISLTKTQLELLRGDDRWEKFLADVTSFCIKRKIEVPKMDDRYKPIARSKRHYVKLNDRFDEVNIDLLICMSSFDPKDSFASFGKDSLVKLAKFYPKDFPVTDLRRLTYQLDNFIVDMRGDQRFSKVKTIAKLSVLLVQTNKHVLHSYVYKLLKLVLLLPVTTASVERAFSVMNFIKNKLRNSMGDQYLNDCLVTFIEKQFFLCVADEDIISRFQKSPRRVNL